MNHRRLSDEEFEQLLIGARSEFRSAALAYCGGCVEDAEDLLQDACIRAYTFRRSFDPSRGFGPWFRQLMCNLARDRWRSRSKRAEHVQELSLSVYAHRAESVLASNFIEDVEVLSYLLHIANGLGLSDAEFTALHARIIIGHTYEMAAMLANMSPSKVRSIIVRVEAFLRYCEGITDDD